MPRSPSRSLSPGSDDSDGSDGSESSGVEFTPPSPEVVAAYDTLMASLLPTDMDLGAAAAPEDGTAPCSGAPLPTATPATSSSAAATAATTAAATAAAAADADADAAAEAALGRPMTKAEKQNAKKKRRKERERALRAEAEAVRAAAEPKVEVVQDAPVDFRLFSSAPIRPISLSTAETYPLPRNPRLAPLPPAIRDRIRRCAAEAAVDSAQVAACACASTSRPQVAEKELDLDAYVLRPGQDLRAKHDRGKKRGKGGGEAAEAGMPAIFVAIAPLGREGKCVAVPHLKLDPQRADSTLGDRVDGNGNGKRKRRRRAYREFPPAQFWRPEQGAEGRSAGYFYGWSV